MVNTKRNWVVWSLVIFIILFISSVIYAIFLYMDLNEKRTAGYSETTKEVLNQTSITKITNIETFNGEAAYHVVQGINKSGEEKLIFYPLEGKEKTLKRVDTKDIMSKQAIHKQWNADCNSCKLIKITPALIEEEVLWELTYYDKHNRYVFDYVSIYDGSPYEEIRYLRMFN